MIDVKIKCIHITFDYFIDILLVSFTRFDILENQPILFKEKFSARITEYDYLLHVWGPC